jgi:hypothetical protein
MCRQAWITSHALVKELRYGKRLSKVKELQSTVDNVLKHYGIDLVA